MLRRPMNTLSFVSLSGYITVKAPLFAVVASPVEIDTDPLWPDDDTACSIGRFNAYRAWSSVTSKVFLAWFNHYFPVELGNQYEWVSPSYGQGTRRTFWCTAKQKVNRNWQAIVVTWHSLHNTPRAIVRPDTSSLNDLTLYPESNCETWHWFIEWLDTIPSREAEEQCVYEYRNKNRILTLLADLTLRVV